MRRYGCWVGEPKGRLENVERCVAETRTGMHAHQCTRKRGHGPDGLLCKKHAKMIAAGRNLSVPEDE